MISKALGASLEFSQEATVRIGEMTMASHDERAEALAAKITARAMDALSTLDREMAVMKWPSEFRAIMWGAVAAIAAKREADARTAQ